MYSTRSLLESDFPPLLKDISARPSNLYSKYKNFNEDIFDNCLAVVGSRRMTDYGEHVTNDLVGDLARRGITIVSGFMFGIDACAHKACVDAGGRTIAIMPCGIERITPAYQEELYYSILEYGGLIMSEYEGEMVPQKWMFTKRNRIVAGISSAILVIEAERHSGSLITATFAKEFNRKIFAIPGNIYSKKSEGTNWLIKNGAVPATATSDILNHFKSDSSDTAQDMFMPTDTVQEKVFSVINQLPMTKDEIVRTCEYGISEISIALIELTLMNAIEERHGYWYVK